MDFFDNSVGIGVQEIGTNAENLTTDIAVINFTLFLTEESHIFW